MLPSSIGEALGVQDAAAADGQQTFGRVERRLHQDLGHIAGLVGFLIRDQCDFFLLDIPRGTQVAAADPADELGFVAASQLIADQGRDAVAAAHRGFELAGNRFFRRSQACIPAHRLLFPASCRLHISIPAGRR